MKAPLGVKKMLLHLSPSYNALFDSIIYPPETNRKSLYLKIDFVGRLSSIFFGGV